MAGEWRRVLVSDIAEVVGGGTPSTRNPDNFGGSIPWLTPRDLSTHSGRYISKGERSITEQGLASSSARLLPQKAVLLTTRAPVGYLALAANVLSTNQGFRSLVVREGFSPEFIYYLLKNDVERLKSFAVGSTFQELSGSALKELDYYIPPLEEQKAIACILGALDDKIELNNRMNQTLEAMTRAIFKSWFVDFDPVHAKAEGRDPRLPDHIAALFPESFEEWELGDIPAGWKESTLGAICDKPQYGYTASAEDTPVGPHFVRITDINKQSFIDWRTVPYCTIAPSEREKYRLHEGDILVARMADPGHGVLVEEEVEAVFASYLIRFRPTEELYGRYLQYWFRSRPYWNLVRARQAGTTRATLNAQVLARFTLLLPDSAALSVFKQQANALRSRIVANIRETATLAGVRDSLLPKLISGELRVSDPQRIIGRAI